MSSALWLQLTLVVYYLPFIVVAPWTIQEIRSRLPSSALYLALQPTRTLIYLNSLLNPIIYCLRMKEVRQAAQDTIRQMFCS